MAAAISLRPEDDRGRRILDELEQETDSRRMKVTVDDDGTRHYHLNPQDQVVDALDSMLDRVDADWADHVTNVNPRKFRFRFF